MLLVLSKHNYLSIYKPNKYNILLFVNWYYNYEMGKVSKI